MTQEPVSPKSLIPSIPSSIDAAILRALHKDSARRPARVEEFLLELEGGLGGAPPEPYPSANLASTPVEPEPLVIATTESCDSDAPEDADEAAFARRAQFLRRRSIAAIATAALALLGLAVGLARRHPPARVDLAPRPRLEAARLPPKAPAVPNAHIRITAEPQHATLLIDGEVVPNPFEAAVPIDAWNHLIEATLESRTVARQWVQFDRDHDFHLAAPLAPRRSLAKAAAPKPAAVKPTIVAPVTAQPKKNGDTGLIGYPE